MKVKTDIDKNRFFLLFFILSGISSTVSQSMIFREFLVIFYGNELILGFILFAWLFSIMAGARLFSKIKLRIRNYQKLYLKIIFVYSILPFFLIPLIRVSRNLLGVEFGLYIPFIRMALLSFLITFPLGVLMGFAFPLGCGIIKGRDPVSRLYVSESLGSLLGGILFSFLLVRFLPAQTIASIIMLSYSILIIIFGFINPKNSETRQKLYPCLFLFLSIAGLIYSFDIDRKTTQIRWNTLISNMPLLSSVDSNYQNLALTGRMDQYSVFFNGVYGFSFPDEYEDMLTANHILTQASHTDQILIIGEVTPGILGEMLKHRVKKITCVYFDPALYNMLMPYLSSEDLMIMKDEKVNLIFQDGRSFVKNTNETYDFVWLNLPDPSNALLNRYYTYEFFLELSKKMNERGVVCLCLTSSENYMGSEILDYNRTIYKTMEAVFPGIALCPSTPAYFFASKDKEGVSESPAELVRRFESRAVRDTDFVPDMFEYLYEPERIKFKRDFLESGGEIPLNTDLAPVAYIHNLKLWDRYSDSRLSGIIEFFQARGIRFWSAIPWLYVLYFLFSAGNLEKRKARERAGIYSVFATGLTAMGLSMILIYAYQNFFGYLFERIGLLIALFMMGLALGGWFSSLRIRNGRKIKDHLLIVLMAVTLLVLSLPFLLNSFDNLPSGFHSIFYLFMILSGFLTGQIFPLAVEIIKVSQVGISRSAAKINAADHLGGCLGALLIGTFLIPILGVPGSAMILAVLQASALGMWVIYHIKFVW